MYQRKMETKILVINIREGIRNAEVIRTSGHEYAAIRAQGLKGQWGGHVARMKQGRWAYTAMVWDPMTGSRSRRLPETKMITRIQVSNGCIVDENHKR